MQRARGTQSGGAATEGFNAVGPQPKELGTQYPRRCFLFRACPPVFRPGGTPEEISRGQVRGSGRRPRNPRRVAPCPGGASKKWAGMLAARKHGFGPALAARPAECAARRRRRCGGWLRRKTSSMPRWGMAHSAWRPGRHPLARACPRLISCGVPPGREARRRRQFSGGLLAASSTAKSSRRASMFLAPTGRTDTSRGHRPGLALARPQSPEGAPHFRALLRPQDAPSGLGSLWRSNPGRRYALPWAGISPPRWG